MDLEGRLRAQRLNTFSEVPNLDSMLDRVTGDPALPRLDGRGRDGVARPGMPVLWVVAAVLITALAIPVWRIGRMRHDGAVGLGSAGVVGVTWRLVSISPTGGPLPPGPSGIGSLRIDDAKYIASDGCNHIVGTAVLTRTTITFATTSTTQAACYASASVAEALNSVTRWAITADHLILRTAAGRTLKYARP